MTRTVLNSRRSRRTSCSILALATVLSVGATPADAQSFLGTGTYATNPNATGITTAPGTTTINVNAGNTVINWTPTDNAINNNQPINFQNAGTTATFKSAGGDFAVLNNIGVIDTSRVVTMSGTVNGLTGLTQGGSIYFYSPSGFLINNGATFNVASLVLSALPITSAQFANVGSTGYGSVQFGTAVNPNATITMNGNVNAFTPPAGGFGGLKGAGYVALVAPSIVQGSTSKFDVNGSTALVAAEAATITFSTDNLFTVQVTTGTTSATGLSVNGQITGDTPQGSTDKQGIYLVAVPKNQALTMAFGSNAKLGFTLANAAVDDNGTIILSAGNDISAGTLGAKSAATGTGTASIQVGGSSFTNNVIAEATGSANFNSTAGQTTTFSNNLTAHGNGGATFSATGAGAIANVTKNLSLSASRTGGTGQSVTGGSVGLSAANAGSVTVGGTISLNADATGGDSSSGTAGSGTGGTITIGASGGSTLNLGSLTASSATGTGGNALAPGVAGGAGTGGNITVTADTGGIINMPNPLTLNVEGSGGSGIGAGAGGNGTGGNARIQVGNNGKLTFGGNVLLDADGYGGGSGSGSGGVGHGGTAIVEAVAGSTSSGLMTFNSEVDLSADGEGGFSDGTAGAGQGGTAQLTSSAHHFVLNNFVDIRARGFGGDSNIGTGGSGTGGLASINATGTADVDSFSDMNLSASGDGGGGVTGGSGVGGNAEIKSQSSVTLSNGTVEIHADGDGGEGAGLGDAGTIHVEASNGGNLTIANLDANAVGNGGNSFSNVSGNGVGGDIFIQSFANSPLTFTGALQANADGNGGDTGFQVDGGSGTGGTITLQATGANALVSVGGNIDFSANGNGGYGIGDCFSCGGSGGDGFGGIIHVGADGAIASILVTGWLSATADGYGSTGIDADGGFGKGGEVKISAGNGAKLEVDNFVEASADGHGGYRDDGGYGGDLAVAGDGEGGFVELFSWGTGLSSIKLNSVELEAEGIGGGNVVDTLTAFGGNGLGGKAWIDAQSGTIDVTNGASVSATGSGGYADFGTGGDGTGKNALISAIGGTIHLGSAYIDSSGYGGDGLAGGKGTGGGIVTSSGVVDGASLFASNGTLTAGYASVYSDGVGGNASRGAGGVGSGGVARIFATSNDAGASQITISGIESSAYVSASGLGGRGGTGLAGVNGTSGLTATNGTAGGVGGAGGDGLGGLAFAQAAAGNGHLSIDNVSVNATGFGGQGGAGGVGGAGGTASAGLGGSGGAGGIGGAGGAGFGGQASFGTQSLIEVLPGSNLGTATFGNAYADSSAGGGNGGNGGSGGAAGTGSSGNGVAGAGGAGGHGGNALGGFTNLLVRGSAVTVSGDAELHADATGGDGGKGNGDGVGGNATVGSANPATDARGVNVVVTERAGTPAQRGTLNAGNIYGTAVAVAGAGGVSQTMGGNQFFVRNSDATVGSVDLRVGADNIGSGAVPDSIFLANGTINVSGTFGFATDGNLSLFVDNGTLDVSAGTLDLAAGNFVHNPATPTNLGSIKAGTAIIATDQDFVADGIWYVTNDFIVDAPGLIELDAVHGLNGVDFTAGESVTIPTIDAGTYVSLVAGGNISLSGDVHAGADVDATAGGLIDMKNAVAGQSIDIDASGNVNALNLTAGDSIYASSDANVTVGNLSAGLVNPSSDADARYNVGIRAQGNILTGNIATTTAFEGRGVVELGARGTATTGTINAGYLLGLVDGDMTFGTTNTAEGIYLAGYSMMALGGEIGDEFFNPGAIIGSPPPPNATQGDITFTSTVSTPGSLTAAAGSDIQFMNDLQVGHSALLYALHGGIFMPNANVGYIDAIAGEFFANTLNSGSEAHIHTGGDININSLSAQTPFSGHFAIDVGGFNVSIGGIFGRGGINLGSNGTMTIGNAFTGDVLFANANGAMEFGNIQAGLVNPPPQTGPMSVALQSNTSINTGTIDAIYGVALLSPGTVHTGNINAGTDVLGLANGNINLGNIDAGGRILLAGYSMYTDAGGTFPVTDTFDFEPIFGAAVVKKTTGSITVGNISTDTFTAGAGTNLIVAGDLQAGGDVNLYAGSAINLKNADAGYFNAVSGTTFDSLNLTSNQDVRIDSGGNVTIGHLVAGTPADGAEHVAVRIISDGSISLTDANSAGGMDITAAGNVTGGAMTTGDALYTDALGAIHYGNISAGLINPQPQSGPLSVALAAGTSIDTGTIAAAYGVGLASPGTVHTGNINAGTDVLGLVHGDINLGDVTAGGRVLLADYAMYTNAGGTIPTTDGTLDYEGMFAATPIRTGGSIAAGNIDAGSFTAAAGGNLTIGTLVADNGISLDAGAAITTGNLDVGDFVLANGGSITTGTIDASSVNMISTGGNISTGTVDATGNVTLNAFADIITGSIIGGNIDLLAGDDITTGALTSQIADILLNAGGDIATGGINSHRNVQANAGAGLTTGAVQSLGFVDLHSTGNMQTQNIEAGSYLNADAGGTMTLGAIVAGLDADLSSTGNMTFGNASIGHAFDFESDASVTGGSVTAGNEISGGAGGTMNVGNLIAGLSLDGDFSIGLGAIGNLTVGNATGPGPVGLATQANLVTGNLNSNQLIMTLVGGDTTTGSITTPDAPGAQVYMADDSMFTTGGGVINGDSNFDPNVVLALAPVPTGGSITINGAVTTGSFRAAAGTGLTTQGITATNATASAGGTATINGAWNISNNAQLTSNDINITGTGSMRGGNRLTLASSNPLQMLIGDGFTGSGYSLSNAEFGRIGGGQVVLVGRGDATAALDMLVGNLTVSGSQLTTPTSAFSFTVGNLQTLAPSGVIRVVGNVNASGFAAGNAIEFHSTRFDLDVATGSVGISSSGGLAGKIGILANSVHVATGKILDKLAANPTYTNYQQELNLGATGTASHPEGVLRADTVSIQSGNLADVLIQNTGTGGPSGSPAGFLARQFLINGTPGGAGTAGSINLVANGQLVADGATLTGVAVRDALYPEGADIGAFTANSTINGCPLTGQCIIKPPAPPVNGLVENQIDLITNNPLGDSEFGNEPDIDDNEAGDEGATNPISPPQPLFDTRPLIPSGDVNDPVSGTGNPALLGSDQQCDDPDEQGQCPSPVKGDDQ